MSFSYSPKIVTDGLVLYLDAANTRSYPGSGTTWTDLSRGGNTGTLVNGPTFNSTNGGSILFDGSNDYIQTANINLTNTNAVSVDFWCKLNSYTEVIGAGKVLVEFSTNFNSSLVGFLVAIADDSNELYGNTFPITLNLRGNIGFNVTYFPKTLVNDLSWHHWVCIFNKGLTGSEGLLYIDGILISGTLTSLNSNNTNNFGNLPLFLSGRAAVANSNQQTGNIKLYNRALSATEVLQNYNALKSRFGL
jgi:hypothetical protein